MINRLHRRRLWHHLPQLIINDVSRPGAPSPKGPPESLMPTPGDIQHTSSSPAEVDQGDQSERRRYYRVRSASGIDWNYPLEGQLEPSLKGGQVNPNPSMISACSASKSPSWIIAPSIRSTPATMSLELCRRRMVYMKSRCVK